MSAIGIKVLAAALLSILWLLPAVAHGAAPVVLENAVQSADVDFGRTVRFSLEAEWDGADPVQVTIFFGLPGSPSRIFANVEPKLAGDQLSADHTWDILGALVPGAELEYYWRVRLGDGSELRTDPSRIIYQDSSLPWLTIGDGPVEIQWYEGGQEFGRKALAAAASALQRLRENFGVELERSTRIVLYAESDRMRDALGGGTSPWTAGQAIAPFNTIVLHAPSMSHELDVLIAHELTHIVVDQITRNPFSGPPAWVHEGLATYIESTGAPRFDYDGIVEAAVQSESIISLRGLTASFPADNTRAILAYAESNSLMRFVIEKYGKESVRQLLDVYKSGVTDDEAVAKSLGISLTELESLWFEHIGLIVESQDARTDAETPTVDSVSDLVERPGKAVVESSGETPTPSPAPATRVAESTAAVAAITATVPIPAAPPVPPVASSPSQVLPRPDVVRNVAIGSVAVILLIVGFVIHQFRASRRRE